MRAANYLAIIFSASVTACALPPVCAPANYGSARSVDSALKDAKNTGDFKSAGSVSSLGGSKAGFKTNSGTTGCQP